LVRRAQTLQDAAIQLVRRTPSVVSKGSTVGRFRKRATLSAPRRAGAALADREASMSPAAHFGRKMLAAGAGYRGILKDSRLRRDFSGPLSRRAMPPRLRMPARGPS
jgi:hypothetical protein